MSVPVFIIKSLGLGFWVSLRLLPVLILMGLLTASLIFSTDNPYVIGMVGFFLAVFGGAFVNVTAYRAGLVALGASTAPTAKGLFVASFRVIVLAILIAIIQIVLVFLAAFFAFSFIIGMNAPAPLSPSSTLALEGAASLVPELAGTGQQTQSFLDTMVALDSNPVFSLAVTAASYFLSFAIYALFSVPLAANAANAARRSPGHDLFYGLAAYFPHLMTLYLLIFLVPFLLLAIAAPALAITFMDTLTSLQSIGTLLALGIAVFVAFYYLSCVSYGGGALAYAEFRQGIIAEREYENAPVIDQVEQEASVRSLRQQRQSQTKGPGVYIPDRQRPRD